MIPTLYPCDPEVLDHAVHAPYLSRFTGLWSGLKIVTAVVDGSMTVALDSTRVEPSGRRMGWRPMPYARDHDSKLMNSTRHRSRQGRGRPPRAMRVERPLTLSIGFVPLTRLRVGL